MRARLSKISVAGIAVVLGLTAVAPALARGNEQRDQPTLAAGKTETTEASIATFAWFWRDQQQQKVTNPVDGTDIATLELKNPYCPDTSPAGSPPEQACREGRLPVEVRGDYERPHKLSALNFDLSMVPPGSKITKFEVRLWEAQDQQSNATQYNVDKKRIQACEIHDVFGEGEARLYKERPEYECTDQDASATRDSIKVGKGDNEKQLFFWDLDLTTQAQEWMKKEVFFTSVMLHPKAPRDPASDDQAWQVVFAGPMERKYGIDTTVTYDPPATVQPTPTIDPTLPTDTGDPTSNTNTGIDTTTTTTTTGTDFGTSTTTTTTTGSSTSPTTTTPTGTDATDAGAPTDTAADTPAEPTAADNPQLASDEEPVPSGLPLYVWLALLAGMIGFSLVRSVVLEKNTGVRPNGVLAQIQKLNAQRRGTTTTSATGGSSPFAGLVAGLGALGSKITTGAGKLAALVSRKKG